MNIIQIRCFWEVVKTRNVTEAAERLYLTQSTVSKKISALENELGILLFERRGRTMLLTHNGKELLESFGEIISAYEKTEHTVETIRRSNRRPDGTVTMSLIPVVESLGLISVINHFADANENFKPLLEIADENSVILSLQSGHCDLAFCSDLMLDNKLYCIEKHSTHKFKLVVSKTHKFAQKNELRLKDIMDEKLVLLHPVSMLYNLCIQACEAEGFYPNILLTTNWSNIAMEYIRSSDCIFMTVDTVDAYPSDYHIVIDLQDSPQFDYVFAWRKPDELPDAVREFIRSLSLNN